MSARAVSSISDIADAQRLVEFVSSSRAFPRCSKLCFDIKGLDRVDCARIMASYVRGFGSKNVLDLQDKTLDIRPPHTPKLYL